MLVFVVECVATLVAVAISAGLKIYITNFTVSYSLEFGPLLLLGDYCSREWSLDWRFFFYDRVS